MLARHCQRDHSSHLISDGIVLCFGSAFCWGPCLSIHCKGSSDNSTQCPASWFFRKGASKLTKFIEIMNVSSLLVILNMNNYNMHTWAWWISANQYLMAQFQYIHLLKNCQTSGCSCSFGVFGSSWHAGLPKDCGSNLDSPSSSRWGFLQACSIDTSAVSDTLTDGQFFQLGFLGQTPCQTVWIRLYF